MNPKIKLRHMYSNGLISDNYLELMKDICIKYNYSLSKAYLLAVRYIERIMIVKVKKSIEDITPDDIYDCYRSKQDAAKVVFVILQELDIIDKNLKYDNSKNYKDKKINRFELDENVTENDKEIYNSYNNYISIQGCSESLKSKNRMIVKVFINWLRNVIDTDVEIRNIKYINIIDFSIYLKTYKSPFSKDDNYAEQTYINLISAFRNFIEFAIEKNIFNYEFKIEYISEGGINIASYDIKRLHNAIPKQDRILIEDAVIEYNEEKELYTIPDMLKVIYFCGLRINEAIHLKLDCIRGGEKTPTLYIHKSKNKKPRYIPLIKEVYDIIKKWQKINYDSDPVYSKYDELDEKRLFSIKRRADKSALPGVGSVRTKFHAIIKNKFDDHDKKYDVHSLRKLRITIWLENGLSFEEVCALAGHNRENSQNDYFISKECMIEDGENVFNGIYSDYMVEDNRFDLEKYEKNIKVKKEEYLTELEKSFIEIENKDIVNVVTEMAYKEFPELFFPLVNGICGAFYEDEEFDCEVLKVPCIDCDDLIGTSNYKQEIDKYIFDVFEALNLHEKRNLDGLVNKDKELIRRLKIFYNKKFNLSIEDVNKLFEDIRSKTLKRRRRKK